MIEYPHAPLLTNFKDILLFEGDPLFPPVPCRSCPSFAEVPKERHVTQHTVPVAPTKNTGRSSHSVHGVHGSL